MNMKTILRAAAVLVMIAGLAGGNAVMGQGGSSASRRQLAETVKRKDLVPELEREIPRLMAEGEVPGLQIAVVRGGKVEWIKSFGVRNAETGEAVTDATIFEAASLSKPVFAYAVMKLVEAGRIDLDRPLQSYLGEPYLKDDDRINKITARMALDHTTGFQNESRPGQPQPNFGF